MYHNGWRYIFKKDTKQLTHLIAKKTLSGSSSSAKILENSDVNNFL